MAIEKKLIIVKDLISEGKITELVDIFNYIDKKYIHEKTGFNYYRLLRCIKNPKAFKYEDTFTIARALQVTPEQINLLIMNQIVAKKK